MKISELLEGLERQRSEVGDVDVRVGGQTGGIPFAHPVTSARLSCVIGGESSVVIWGSEPNDPKLSHGGGWRGLCRWVERWRRSAAQAVTAVAVGCSAWLGVSDRIQKAAKLLLKEDGWHVRYPGLNGQRYLVPLHTHNYDDAYERTNRLLREHSVEWIIS